VLPKLEDLSEQYKTNWRRLEQEMRESKVKDPIEFFSTALDAQDEADKSDFLKK